MATDKKLPLPVGRERREPGSAIIDLVGRQTSVCFNNHPMKEMRLKEPGAIETTLIDERESFQPRTPILRNTYSDEALQVLLNANSITSEDNRSKNGALWVNLDDDKSEIAQQLANWGFKYKSGRGWWRT